MSTIKLGSITESKSTPEVGNYVASIINSESGPMHPVLLQDTEKLDSLFGNFKYRGLYDRLIQHDIPSVLTPVITEESKYNRASLRLNQGDAYIKVAYPRADTLYHNTTPPASSSGSSSSGGIILIKQRVEENQQYTIHTNSTHPISYYAISDEGQVLTHGYFTVKYELVNGTYDIIFEDVLINATIYVPYYPSIDDNPSLIESYELTQESSFYPLGDHSMIVPDAVILQEYHDGLQDGWYELPIGLGYNTVIVGNMPGILPDSDNVLAFSIQYTESPTIAYLRWLPSNLIKSGIAATDPGTTVTYDLGYIPNLRPLVHITQGGMSYYVDAGGYVSVESMTDTSAVVIDNGYLPPSYGNAEYQYLNIPYGSSAQITQGVLNNGYTLSQVLDFSSIGDSFNKEVQYVVIPMYVNDELVYIQYTTKDEETWQNMVRYTIDMPTTNPQDFVDQLVYFLINGDGSPSGGRYHMDAEHVLTYTDECVNAFTSAWEYATSEYPVGEPHSEQEVPIGEFLLWRDLFISKIHYTEIYLGSNELVVTLANEVTANSDLSYFISVIKTESGPIRKIRLIYDKLTDFQRLYDFEGLRCYNCFNAEQDKLCDFTESKKLVEFYSKIKGPQGANTNIVIEQLLDGYYALTISLGSIIENIEVYTIKSDLVPDDVINLHDLGKYSELVEVKVYDYLLPSGKLIDQRDFLDYGEMDEFNVSCVRTILLPSGEYKLSRNQTETILYDDWANTLSDLCDTGYLPDLFILPEAFEHHEYEQYKDILSYVRGNEPSYGGICPSGIYSQALCAVSWRYMQNSNPAKFPTRCNRMLYFYGDLTLDGELYPSSYPYIEAIIRGTGLTLPDELMLYDIDSVNQGSIISKSCQPYQITSIDTDGDETKISWVDALGNTSEHNNIIDTRFYLEAVKPISYLLKLRHINYLDYNGLDYYYLTLKEVDDLSGGPQRSIFLAQYSCSKISREFMRSSGNLIASNPANHQNVVVNIINKLINTVPYVDSIEHTLEYRGHELSIHLTVTLIKLINKEFKLDYILNLT